MNSTSRFGLWFMAILSAGLFLLPGCSHRKTVPPVGKGSAPIYETPEAVLSMPACEAVIVERGPCFLRLQTTDHKTFYLGSPALNPEVTDFLSVLKEGQTYRFPETFRLFQDQRAKASGKN